MALPRTCRYLLLDKVKDPRRFKNINKPHLKYQSQSNSAWIAFYSKIVWEIQTKTFKVKKVVLIIDNCPPNPIIDNLSHAKLVFLSLCTTSVSQLWINNTYKEELLLYWIQYKHLLKYRVGCFWSFSYDYTIN